MRPIAGPDAPADDTSWRDLSGSERGLVVSGAVGVLLLVLAALALPTVLVLLSSALLLPDVLRFDGWAPAVLAALLICALAALGDLLTASVGRSLEQRLPGPAGRLARLAVRGLTTAAVALVCLSVLPGVHLQGTWLVLVLGVLSAAADAAADAVGGTPATRRA